LLDQLTFEQMKELEGTSLWAYPEADHRVELRIVDVAKVMESEAARLTRDAFSIYFLGPASYVMKQGMVAVQHDAFPEPFDLFVVPVEERQDGLLYEAVFT
jgi:hypothetical protein